VKERKNQRGYRLQSKGTVESIEGKKMCHMKRRALGDNLNSETLGHMRHSFQNAVAMCVPSQWQLADFH
jgi:hypothetical protein